MLSSVNCFYYLKKDASIALIVVIGIEQNRRAFVKSISRGVIEFAVADAVRHVNYDANGGPNQHSHDGFDGQAANQVDVCQHTDQRQQRNEGRLESVGAISVAGFD